MGWRRASFRVLVALLWSLPLPVVATPQPAQTLEYSVKANYLVRFAAFVDWPPRAFASSQSPVVICVAGRDPFSGANVSSDRGMIHFAISDDRVRFHIDLQAASRSGLSISSRLLNLALSVRGG